MIVYRTISSDELLNLINGDKIEKYNTVRGENTFNYEKGKSYIHFLNIKNMHYII